LPEVGGETCLFWDEKEKAGLGACRETYKKSKEFFMSVFPVK